MSDSGARLQRRELRRMRRTAQAHSALSSALPRSTRDLQGIATCGHLSLSVLERTLRSRVYDKFQSGWFPRALGRRADHDCTSSRKQVTRVKGLARLPDSSTTAQDLLRPDKPFRARCRRSASSIAQNWFLTSRLFRAAAVRRASGHADLCRSHLGIIPGVKIMWMPVFGTFLQVLDSTRNNNRIGITMDCRLIHTKIELRP